MGIDDKLRSKNRRTVRYFLTDHLGSTEALANASGAIVSSTSYDSFGNATSNIATSYRYTGREYDADTGLYYYRNRWYDPETGRFISKDPIGFAGGDINLYGYVGNNPLSFVDPYGNYACKRQEQKDCEKEIARMFGDPGAYFFDHTNGTFDRAYGHHRSSTKRLHSHFYGSQNDTSKSTGIYIPKEGKLVSPPIKRRVPGSKFLGSSKDADGTHNANYVLIQFANLRVTLAIFHVDNFKLEKQKDGRTRIGTIGFTDADDYGSGGQTSVGTSTGRGGHSHFALFDGLRNRLGGKRVNFKRLCSKK